jgi:glycosyltransferase involved in cell wall biosynthesis
MTGGSTTEGAEPDVEVPEALNRLKPMELPPLPENTLLSVLMVNYNYGRYIGQAIESVLAQTYQNFEICICDDGSTDDSVAVIEAHSRRDPRIKVTIQENAGVAAALNTAWSMASGEVIALLDSDDLYLPEKLEAVVGAFRNNPKSGMCVHHFERFSGRARHLGDSLAARLPNGWMAPAILLRGHIEAFVPASGQSWRKEAVQRLFPVPINLRAWVDVYLARSALLCVEVTSVDRVLMRYRMHENNLSSRRHTHQEYVRELLSVVKAVHEAVTDRLVRWYGPPIRSSYRLEANSQYWFLLLLTAVYERPRPDLVGNISFERALARITAKERMLIRVACWLPFTLSKPLLAFWLQNSPARYRLKRVIWPLLRLAAG